MPDTNAAGVLTGNASDSAELPVAAFHARLAVQGEVGLQLDQLNSYGVVSRQWGAVQDYLERHPDLAALLPAICEQVRQEFRRPDELAIELYRDPEIKDEYLTLYIRQMRYEADIMVHLEEAMRFDWTCGR
jgi:hypothetical protein